MKSKLSLRGRFLRTLIIFSFLTLVLWFGYHQTNFTAVSRIAEESTRLAAENLTGQISAEFAQLRTITSTIAGSSYIQDFLNERDWMAYYDKAGIASEIIRQTAFPITSADSVLAINAEGIAYRFSGGLSSQSCEELYKSIQGAGTIYTVVELDNTLFYCHSAPVFDFSGKSPVRLGNVSILTGLEKTRNMLTFEDSLINMDIAVIIDGEIIMSNNYALEGTSADALPGAYELVTTTRVDGTPLSIAAAIPRSALFPGSNMFLVTSLVFIGLMLVVILVLYRYLSTEMIQPMASVIAGVASLDGGKNKRLAEMPVLGKPDFQSLALTINDMLERTEKHNAELMTERQKVFDAEMARQKMRMGLLAQQMDAHFMTNTLVGIQSLIARGNSEQALQMSDGLGFLLRHQHKGDMPVNIFEEFLAIQKYVEVMNIRHGNRFKYDYDLDEALCDYLMPGFVMQPIVENALEHGLGGKEQDARLYIKGYIENGRVCMEISDNGTGVPPGKLKSVRENLENAEPRDFPEPGLHGVALMNVQRRLRLQFGNDYGVQIESDFGKGTTVTLTFPLIADKETGDVL